MANNQSKPVHPWDYLRACIDFGSGLIKIAAQHVLKGTCPSEDGIEVVRLFDAQHPEVEQVIIYDDAGQAHLGRSAVSQWLSDYPDEMPCLLELYKLAMGRQYLHSVYAQQVLETLKAKAEVGASAEVKSKTEADASAEIESLVTDVLKICKAEILRYMRHKSLSSLSVPSGTNEDKYWTTLPIELQLTVPCDWNGTPRGIMRNAVAKAGFTDTRLRSEPLCAAVQYIYKYYAAGKVSIGDSMTFLDVGRGTADGATVRVDAPPSPGQRPTLVVVGDTHGGLAGGQIVNEEACRSVFRRIGKEVEIARFLNHIGISEADLLHQINITVESWKTQFPDQMRHRRGYKILINCSLHQHEQGVEDPEFNFTWDEIEGLFKTAAQKATDVLRRHMNHNPPENRKGVVLTGGGAQNQKLRDAILDYLKPSGVPLFHENWEKDAVVRGALKHYLENDHDDLPNKLSFYATQDEPWQRELHKVHGGETYVHELHREKYALDRLVHLLSIEEGEEVTYHAVPMRFEIEAKRRYCARLRVNIYSSTEKNKAHQPLKNNDGELQDGLYDWPMAYEDLVDLEALGYKPEEPRAVRSKKGRSRRKLRKGQVAAARYYIFWGIVEMFLVDNHLEVTLKLLKAKTEVTHPPDILARSEIWDIRRSHTVSNGSAPANVPQKRKCSFQDAPTALKRPAVNITEPTPSGRGETRTDNAFAERSGRTQQEQAEEHEHGIGPENEDPTLDGLNSSVTTSSVASTAATSVHPAEDDGETPLTIEKVRSLADQALNLIQRSWDSDDDEIIGTSSHHRVAARPADRASDLRTALGPAENYPIANGPNKEPRRGRPSKKKSYRR